MAAFILVGSLIVIFFVVYILNQNTPEPEGVSLEFSSKCISCKNTGCGVKDKMPKGVVK